MTTLSPAPPRPSAIGRSALVEIAVFFGVALVVDLLWGNGTRFVEVEPHPFWIIVLLMAVQYGTGPALVATAVSSVVLLAGNLPDQRFDQDVHAYTLEVLLRPLLWMVASVVFGELRTRHRSELSQALKRLGDEERRVELLTRAHQDVSAARDRLETRLAGQLRTAAGVLEAARPLETLDPDRVLAGAADLLRTALNARAFSLYLLQGDGLTLAVAEGATEERAPAPRYGAGSPLFQEVVGGQRYVSVATPAGERLLAGQGLMAGPLIDPATGTMLGMLKVDDLRFLDFNLSSLQTLHAVCEWLASAYGSALAHRRSQVRDDVTQLYAMSHLDRQVEYLTEVAVRFDFDLTLLSFQVQVDGLPDEARRTMPAVLGQVAEQVLRGTDLVFGHQPPGTQFVVLLPGATVDGAVVVARKLIAALKDRCGYDVPCASSARAIALAGQGGKRARRVAGSDPVRVA